ncbi:hypothetical protein AKJ16_DCAP08019 [Drosera capensis]
MKLKALLFTGLILMIINLLAGVCSPCISRSWSSRGSSTSLNHWKEIGRIKFAPVFIMNRGLEIESLKVSSGSLDRHVKSAHRRLRTSGLSWPPSPKANIGVHPLPPIPDAPGRP